MPAVRSTELPTPTSIPTRRRAGRACRPSIAPPKARPVRGNEVREGRLPCALPTEGRFQRATAGRTRTAPQASTDGVSSSEAATWRAPTTNASKTRTAPATCLAIAVTRRRAPAPIGASRTATAASTTIAAPAATARPASSMAVPECAPCPVSRERIAMRETRRCPVGAARVAATATSATPQTTPARTTASAARQAVPAPTCPPEVGTAFPAPSCREALAASRMTGAFRRRL